MEILDIFADDAFSLTSMTDSINIVPIQYGRLGELNLFPDRGIPTTTVAIEENHGVLNLLPTARRGSPGSIGVRGKRRMRQLSTVHIPHDTQLTADSLRNRRGRNGTISLETAQGVINQDLTEHRAKHDITREHLRAGALRGVIIDADGTEILDIFAEFGVTQKVIDFTFGGAAADLRITSLNVSRHMEDHINGDVLTGVHALCSPEFFDGFIGHESVKRAWDNHQSNSNKLGDDPRRGFMFGGVTYEEYRGKASELKEDGSSTVREFIPAGDARFFPLGTRTTFRTYNAPSDFMEDVGDDGVPYYAKLAPDPRFNRYVDVHSQQNPLPICLRPALLVRGHSSN